MAAAVGTVPLRSRRRDPDSRLSVGLRVSHLLNTVDFHPPGFSPSATLIIRRFRDPMPRQLQPDVWAVHSTVAWERAAQADLSELSRRAARPASGFVPLNSNAVLFADQGELLACLARDLLSGSASALWWWRAILRSLPTSTLEAIVTAWRRDARYVPSALAHLMSRGEAVSIVSAFSPEQAWAIFREVARSFEIEFLCSVFERPLETSFRPDVSEEPHADMRNVGAIHESSRETRQPVLPPWIKFFPDSLVPSTLGPERSALLGVGLSLQQVPRIVRTQHFAQAFVRWSQFTRQESRTVHEAHEAPASERRESSVIFKKTSRNPALAQEVVAHERQENQIISENASHNETLLSDSGPFQHPPIQSDPLFTAPVATIVPQQPSAPVTAFFTRESTFKSPEPPPPCAPVEKASATVSTLHPAAAGPATKQEILQKKATLADPLSLAKSEAFGGDSFQTELGGVLFLINVLKALDLPRSIETECGRDLSLGSWELLELLGRCLLSPSESHLASDRLWDALAVLDGRTPGTMPGMHFALSPHYRIPKAWTSSASAHISLSSLQIRLRGSHLELWHPDGFPILSRQFAKQPSRHAIRKEIGYFREDSVDCSPFQKAHRPFVGCQPIGIRVGKPLRRFLAFLLPYVRMRLAQSLGISCEHRSVLAKTLLLQPAKLWLTKTHVDLMLDLNRASGRIRLSGLDANPGWMPSLGRVIAFHFG